jgi:uncharacterized protein
MPNTTRRHLMLGGLISGAACACHGQAYAAADTLPRRAVTPPLSFAAYDKARLLDGPFKTQFDHNQALYSRLGTDALLKPFRDRAGQPAPGPDMGGWYDNASDFKVGEPKNIPDNWHGFIPGHSFGQYVSALSRGYAQTKDPATRARIEDLVTAYAKTVSPKFYDDYNLPGYTYDKTVVGLIDAYHYAGIKSAKDALKTTTAAVKPYLPERALTMDEQRQRPHKRIAQTWDETYTLPENQFLAWAWGMGEDHKDMARLYLADATLYNDLSVGKNSIGGKHAYSQVNALSSAAQAYLSLGDPKHLKAAVNGFKILEAQSFATGGWGPDEGLLTDDKIGVLYDKLKSTHHTFETPCGVYGHFKIARYLLSLTGDAHYGDSMERIMINTIMGATPTTEDGKTFYYADYNETARKFFRPEPWPCCSGTYAQLTADYAMSAFLSDAKSLYVNLHIPSAFEARFGKQDVTVRQETLLPNGDTARLSVSAAKPTRFALKLRIPHWSGDKTTISINGQPIALPAQTLGFAAIDRVWKDGDVVDITFDKALRLEPLPAHPEMVALVHGPSVLFVLDDNKTPLTREQFLSAKPDPQVAEQWLIAGTNVRLKPFRAITDETYRLYNQII